LQINFVRKISFDKNRELTFANQKKIIVLRNCERYDGKMGKITKNK